MTDDHRLTVIAAGIAKGAIAKAAQQAGGSRIEVQTLSDIQGAQAVKQGKADYFIGSCATGQGGALSMAIAVLGKDQCVILTERGRMLPAADIRQKAAGGYRAFGVSADNAAQIVTTLVDALLEKHQLK